MPEDSPDPSVCARKAPDSAGSDIARDQAHARHLGHIVQDHYPPHPGDCTDYAMTREEFAEKFEKLGMADFRINGKRIEVDATNPEQIDVSGLIDEIKKAFWEMKQTD